MVGGLLILISLFWVGAGCYVAFYLIILFISVGEDIGSQCGYEI